MAADEHQDWVDRVLARSVWEPPGDFAGRVAARAVTSRRAAAPRALPHVGFWKTVHATLAGLHEEMRARLEGSIWVLTQYRELIGRF